MITGVPGTETVAEFAFGAGDFAPVGDPWEKGRKGTVHFALGDNQNCYPGGQNRSVLHLDGVCHNVSLQILDTGEYIVKDGVSAAVTPLGVVPPGHRASRSFTLADVPPVELAGGSWSRVLVAERPSAATPPPWAIRCSSRDLHRRPVRLGRGARLHRQRPRRDPAGGRGRPAAAGQALYVPAQLWHTVVNPGDEDLAMVFSFPSPGYPPTERREPRGD